VVVGIFVDILVRCAGGVFSEISYVKLNVISCTLPVPSTSLPFLEPKLIINHK